MAGLLACLLRVHLLNRVWTPYSLVRTFLLASLNDSPQEAKLHWLLGTEQHDKAEQAMYGRATTLHPRTLELLDQLGILDDLDQIGYVARDSVTYRDGKRVTARGWEIMYQHMRGTFLDYCLNIRQKYSEEVIRDAYVALGGEPYIGWRLDGFDVEKACDDDYKVVSHVTEASSGRRLTVRRYAGSPLCCCCFRES